MHSTLKLVHPLGEQGAALASKTSVRFESYLEGHQLKVRFEVRSSKSPHVNPALSLSGSQWGLWDWDVVELFLRVGPEAYYEFQVSPLNQHFELKIFEPRKRFDRDFTSGFTHRAFGLNGGQGWGAEMDIPLHALGGSPGAVDLIGNAFAILGAGVERTYWSLHLPPQEVPDFHLPERFAPIL